MTTPARWLVLELRPERDEAAGPDAPLDPDGVLAELLLDAGGRAVEERPRSLVTHVPEPPDPDALVADLRSALREAGLEGVRLDVSVQRHEDWAELWKRGLEPRKLTDRLVVAPSWSDYRAAPGELVVTLDPGMAFGNAEHGTTRGCLRLLDATVRDGDRILDVGAGSGILSIAAALLGAADVVALEGDPWAVTPARENAVANGVGARVDVRGAWIDADDLRALGPRDGVIANIETGILLPLLPGLVHAVAPEGWLLLSGILDHEWETMRAAAAARGFAAVAVDADGEWRSGLFRRER